MSSKMKLQNILSSILTFILLFSSCINTNHSSESEEYKKAEYLVNHLTDSNICFFTNWEYENYKGLNVWRKACWEKGIYTKEYHDCYYAIVFKKNSDSTTITPGNIDNFKKDFPFVFKFDTSKYGDLSFSINKKKELSIYCIRLHKGDDNLVNLKSGIKVSDIFKTENPFEKILSFEKIKNEIEIIKTLYRPEAGNYIQFYLNDSTIVTYFPEKLNLNLKLKKFWEPILYQGRKIKKNWYFRHEKPGTS